MNKKILVIFVALLVLSITLTPFALAKPWNYPKNNDKFKTYSVSLIPNPIPIANADVKYIPSEDNPNKAIQSWVEEHIVYTITVDEVPYNLHTDFEYSGVAVITAFGAPFTLSPFGTIQGDQLNQFRVEYMYNFSAVSGGIEGTIEMLALSKDGEMSIRSLRGTGELQNVQIMATNVGVGLGHVGIVSGWPE